MAPVFILAVSAAATQYGWPAARLLASGIVEKGRFLDDQNAMGASQPDPLVWILTDGKIGDDVQCLAVARGLSGDVLRRVIAPRAPWSWAAPWGPIDPRDRPENSQSPIAPPFPDIVIASGRRAIPYARAVKRASGAKSCIVMMKNPRISLRHADVVWAPAHDSISGENVITSLTSPHELGLGFADARRQPAPLEPPLLGVILGGPSGGARYDVTAANDLAERINSAAGEFKSIAVTPSRRTPGAFMHTLRDALSGANIYIWDGREKNPYKDILASAKALIVAADSHNMMSEAVASGTGVYAWRPSGLAAKLDWFVGALEKRGAVRRFEASASPFTCAPIDATAEIIREIQTRIKA